ncbi:leukocyte surface antigen CD53-like [Hippoglossus hippoglossus]|uniref:leukocyte surface antigen CD53-like n=1 Tax=Hippoglossus hippoglossus TaxID=8267 RepID=UPI00148BCA57|nr:leukocyte surface antigen CD53-like [Hippoglossus hippoglossus]XP_034451745.1 leukocyte surface antigen CD53-like [Hippoglossus hippoglossus]
MAQRCLKFLKYTMCVANFLCFCCGMAVLGLGVYMMVNFRMVTLLPTLVIINIDKMLLICGIVITCVSFLGFLGALKENRCLLLMYFLLLFLLMLVELTAACLLLVFEGQVATMIEDDLNKSLKEAKANSTDPVLSEWDLVQNNFDCCGINNVLDWEDNVPKSCCLSNCSSPEPHYKQTGCLVKMKTLFEDNFLTTGISVIVLCIIEVLGMCFAMTLFCHISRSGLGYKL